MPYTCNFFDNSLGSFRNYLDDEKSGRLLFISKASSWEKVIPTWVKNAQVQFIQSDGLSAIRR